MRSLLLLPLLLAGTTCWDTDAAHWKERALTAEAKLEEANDRLTKCGCDPASARAATAHQSVSLAHPPIRDALRSGEQVDSDPVGAAVAHARQLAVAANETSTATSMPPLPPPPPPPPLPR